MTNDGGLLDHRRPFYARTLAPRRGRDVAGPRPDKSQLTPDVIPTTRPPHEKRERTNRSSRASKAILPALAPFSKGPKAPDPHPRPFYAPFPRSRFSSFCQEGRGTTVSGLPIYELRIKPVVQSFLAKMEVVRKALSSSRKTGHKEMKKPHLTSD